MSQHQELWKAMDWPMMHFGKIADFQSTSSEDKIRIEKTYSSYKSVQSLLDVADSYTALPNGDMQKILEDSLKKAGDGISATFFNKTPANAFFGEHGYTSIRNELAADLASIDLTTVPKYNFDKVTNGNMAKAKIEEFLSSSKGKELGSSLLLEVLKTKHGFQTYLNSKQSWLDKLEKILEDEAYIRGTLIKQLTMEQELCVKMKLYFLKLLGSHQFEAILKKWVSASSAAMMQPVKDFVEKDNLLLFVKGWLLSHPFSSFIHAACFKSHTKSWVTTDPILLPGQFPISTDHTEISYGDAVRSWLDSSNGPKQYGLLISGRKNSLQKQLDSLEPILEKVLGGGAAKAMKSITQKHLANSLAKENIGQVKKSLKDINCPHLDLKLETGVDCSSGSCQTVGNICIPPMDTLDDLGHHVIFGVDSKYQLSVTVAVPSDYWSYLGYTKLSGTFSMDYATFSGTCTAYDATKADMQGDEFAWKGILEKNLSTQSMLKYARKASLKSSIHAVVKPAVAMLVEGQSQDAIDGSADNFNNYKCYKSEVSQESSSVTNWVEFGKLEMGVDCSSGSCQTVGKICIPPMDTLDDLGHHVIFSVDSKYQLAVTVAVPSDYWSYLGYTKLSGTFSMDYATFSGTCTAYDATKADMQGDEFAWKGILEESLNTESLLKSAKIASLKSSIHAIVQPTLLMSEPSQSQDAVDGAEEDDQTEDSQPTPMSGTVAEMSESTLNSCPDLAKYVDSSEGGPYWAEKLYEKLTEASVLNGLAISDETSNSLTIIQKQTMVLLCLAPDEDYGPDFYRKILMSRLNEMTSYFDGSQDEEEDIKEIFTDSIYQLILKILSGGDDTTAEVTKTLNAELTAAMEELNIATSQTNEDIATDMAAHFGTAISEVVTLFVNKSGTAWDRLLESVADWRKANPGWSGTFKFFSVAICTSLWVCSLCVTLKTFMSWDTLTPEQKVQLIADSTDIVVRSIAGVPDIIENYQTSCENGKLGFDLIKNKIKARMQSTTVDDVQDATVKNVEEIEVVDEAGVDEAIAKATSAQLEDVPEMVSGWQKGVTLGVATIAGAVGLMVEAACIPVIGVVCAIIGIALAIASLFVSRDPPKPKPTKVDIYVDGVGGSFVDALTAPSDTWISDYKEENPET
eukprot:gene614-1276_t